MMCSSDLTLEKATHTMSYIHLYFTMVEVHSLLRFSSYLWRWLSGSSQCNLNLYSALSGSPLKQHFYTLSRNSFNLWCWTCNYNGLLTVLGTNTCYYLMLFSKESGFQTSSLLTVFVSLLSVFETFSKQSYVVRMLRIPENEQQRKFMENATKWTLIHSIRRLEFLGFIMRTEGLVNLTLTAHIENNAEQRKTVHKLHNMLV